MKIFASFASFVTLLLLCQVTFVEEKKLPVPDEAAQKKTSALVADLFKAEYDAAKTAEQKSILAKKMLRVGIDSKDDATGRYVLLRIARDIAAGAGDADTAFAAIEAMEEFYEIDALEMQAEALAKIAGAIKFASEHQKLAPALQSALEKALLRDNFALANRIHAIALASARQARSPEVLRRAIEYGKELEKHESEYNKVRHAFDTLETAPTDAEANLQAGKYLCFIKGNWEKGLPMLVLGGQEPLKSLALSEIDGNKKDPLQLGDGWWNVADSLPASEAQNARIRAIHWYHEALPELTGLSKVKVEQRLAESKLPADAADRHPLAGKMRPGFEGRFGGARMRLVQTGGATPESEEAVDRALRWLADHQNTDGSWSFDHRGGPCQNRCPNAGDLSDARMAATGMALLPFLGRGETHLEGRYKQTVKNGLAYLGRTMKVQEERADLSETGATQYGHGICGIVLCEAYAMTNDRALMRPAQMAVNQIVFNQDPVGGGWRYVSKQTGDTSVLGWQLTALKTAQQAQLKVPPETFAGASKFLDKVQAESGARYGYTSPGTGAATTAIGLLSRMHLGWKHDREALQQGVAHLGNRGPSPSDMYYNYYATQVMHHYEGETWKKWNDAMRDQLVNSQSKQGHADGSWFIDSGEDHGKVRGGRLYATSLATLILEVYYRHKPLYRE